MFQKDPLPAAPIVPVCLAATWVDSSCPISYFAKPEPEIPLLVEFELVGFELVGFELVEFDLMLVPMKPVPPPEPQTWADSGWPTRFQRCRSPAGKMLKAWPRQSSPLSQRLRECWNQMWSPAGKPPLVSLCFPA
jgi:hypothetical protein